MNGLKMVNEKTISESLEFNVTGWDELQIYIDKYFQEGYAIAYLDYKVLVGKVTGGKVGFYQGETFDPKFITKMRVFNTQNELLIWREGEYLFFARMRIDGEGEEEYFVEAEQVLWGRPLDVDDNWILLKEARGTEIYLPYKLKGQGSMRIRIKTRNYVAYNEIGQAGYVDCRFVDFSEGRDR